MELNVDWIGLDCDAYKQREKNSDEYKNWIEIDKKNCEADWKKKKKLSDPSPILIPDE